MNINLKINIFVAAAAILFTAVSTTSARDSEIVRYADKIEAAGKAVKSDFQSYFKRSSAYRHLMADINDLLLVADQVDRLSIDPRSSHSLIKESLDDLENLSLHIQDVVNDVNRGRYSGSVEKGGEQVHRKLNDLTASVRKMQTAMLDYKGQEKGSTVSGTNTSFFSDWEKSIRSLFGLN